MEDLDGDEDEEDLDAQGVNLAQIRKQAGLPELVQDALPSSQAQKYLTLAFSILAHVVLSRVYLRKCLHTRGTGLGKSLANYRAVPEASWKDSQKRRPRWQVYLARLQDCGQGGGSAS